MAILLSVVIVAIVLASNSKLVKNSQDLSR